MNPVLDGLQPSLKLWGEEEIDGAIYTIYLKKVRYHPSDANDQVSHLEWETVRVRVMKAGTLEKLVEGLATDSGELESTYMNIFLSTYRSFAEPNQVLSILLNRYEKLHNEKLQPSCDVKEKHKNTMRKILLVWLDMYPEDFFEPPQFLTLLQIMDFCQKYYPDSVLELRVKHRLQKFRNVEYKERYDSLKLHSSENVASSPVCSRLNFLDIPNEHFALQLTYADNELFKKLLPHQCLGPVWSRRDKAVGFNVLPMTVTATVNQFNAVSLRVLSTVLSDISLKPFVRAKIIMKWINIAHELRYVKNFSSLKAITAALQSNPIYRLEKVWLCVPRENIEAFSELANIFSEENNQTNCREILIKEGSAKFADTLSPNNKQMQKFYEKPIGYASVMQGTIPYLGTFLTDLTMIDTAIPDYLPNGLINFDKRRKEFEILAQIKLLQSAANNYDIAPDTDFQSWFDSMPVLDDRESYEISCLIEPPEQCSTGNKRKIFVKVKNCALKWNHQKSDSSSSTSSSTNPYSDQTTNDMSLVRMQENCCDIKLSGNCSSLSLPHFCSNYLSNDLMQGSQDFYIIKVSLQQNRTCGKGVNLYKSIMLNNGDRTRTVIVNSMIKHGIHGDPDEYLLAQLVPDGEIVFPGSANIFYAVNTSYELNFVLRPRFKSDSNEIKTKKIPLVKRFLNSGS